MLFFFNPIFLSYQQENLVWVIISNRWKLQSLFVTNGKLRSTDIMELKGKFEVKVKVTLVQALRLCTGRTAHRGSRSIALPFHDHGTRLGWGVSVTPPAALYPRERPGTHCTGGWVGPRAGLERCGKPHPTLGFDPQTVQPIASRYTEDATRPTNSK